MLLIETHQGSPQWTAHRATHFNASEAAAMLGECPYKTREQLLHEKKSGVIPAVDSYTQKRFDQGHRFEKLARNVAENAIGEELFPCVGVLEGTKLSASFDGLTMDRSLVWEHKFLSKSLRESIESGDELPLHYRVQLEQQLLVSGASKAIFMASYWSEDGELLEKYTRDYFSDKELRQRIILGWQQFANDLADYQLKERPEPTAESEELPTLPALKFEPKGNLCFSTNLAHFEQQALSVLATINRDLLEESDFAQAEIVIKWCKTGEDQLANAQTKLIASAPDLNEILSTINSIQNQMRAIRLDLDKQVKAEKARIKNALIDTAINQVKVYCEANNVECIEAGLLANKLEWAIKGLKNLDKMQNAIDRVVVAEKTALNKRAENSKLNYLVKLGDINQAIAPLSISAGGLRQLGFTYVAKDKAAKLYRAADFPAIIQRLIACLSITKLPKPLAQTA